MERRTKRPDNFFTSALLEVKTGEKKKPLPSLIRLSLSAVSFRRVGMEMTHVLNITKLRALKLWNYSRFLDLLSRITDSNVTMNLRSLKFVIDPKHGGIYTSCNLILALFLKAF